MLLYSSLAYQPQKELTKTLQAAAKARITIVSLPLVNQWTQDRHAKGGRTPRWRGITLIHESRQAGVPVAIASDNTRDQFYAYGDLDMLEVFNQVCLVYFSMAMYLSLLQIGTYKLLE